MNSFDILETAAALIPEQCRQCGSQCELAREVAALLVAKEMGVYHAEHLVGEEGQRMDEYIESIYPEDYAEDAKVGLRQEVARTMDEIDQQIEEKKDTMAANSRSCTGTLTMRAMKDDLTYTVSVCTSARVSVRGQQQHLPVHLTVS